MSDTFWTQFFAFAIFIVTSVSAYFQIKTRKAVVDSGTANTEKLEEIKKTGIDTHTLVNSNMGIQLQLTSAALKRISDITNAPADIEAYSKAKRLFDDHMAKQAIVDSGIKTD